MTRPKVSIVTITYNHEKYVRQALDSFLAQQTDFDFEIVIADDASTDNTQKIIREYSQAHPKLFKTILRQKNIGAVNNSIDSLKAASGEYIALCEGDDYWTDNRKIQKQVNFMEEHKTHALCFHRVKVVYEDKSASDTVFPDQEPDYFNRDNLLRENFIQTNSVMYRRLDYSHLPTNVMPLDWYLHLYHAKTGDIGFIDEVMSVYRRHPGGVWWDTHKDAGRIWEKHGYNFLILMHELMILYGANKEKKKIIDNHVAGSYEIIASLKPTKIADSIGLMSVRETPVETWSYIKNLIERINYYSEQDAHLKAKLKDETLRNDQNEQRIKQLNAEIESIKSSKSWKVVRGAGLGRQATRHPVKAVKRATKYVHTRKAQSSKE